MHIIDTPLPGVKILEPKVYGDERGYFLESWNAGVFSSIGLDLRFVQDNHSRSVGNTLRGIHYQLVKPQGKLVRVARGNVFDVAVDLRRNSDRFGHWFGTELSDENQRMLWVPPGFGHAFLALSDWVDFQYKCTEFYSPEHDRGIRWDDPSIGIRWPMKKGIFPLLSEKDRKAPLLTEAEVFDSITSVQA
jgi:dTDP-4-dehydrorhamnose 3,5-epimerase